MVWPAQHRRFSFIVHSSTVTRMLQSRLEVTALRGGFTMRPVEVQAPSPNCAGTFQSSGRCFSITFTQSHGFVKCATVRDFNLNQLRLLSLSTQLLFMSTDILRVCRHPVVTPSFSLCNNNILFLLYFIFIEFIGVAQVASVQFYTISLAHCIMHTPTTQSQISFQHRLSPICLLPSSFHPSSPLAITILLFLSFFYLSSLPFSLRPPPPYPLQSSVCSPYL